MTPIDTQVGDQWGAMDAAPRDGTEFQAWWGDQWQPRARFDPEYGSFQLWGRTDYDTEGWETFPIEGYWMPQPAPPAAPRSPGTSTASDPKTSQHPIRGEGELLPCPFCGGSDLRVGGDDKWVGACCLTCGAVGPDHYGSTNDWNRRAHPPTSYEGEGLREKVVGAFLVGATAGILSTVSSDPQDVILERMEADAVQYADAILQALQSASGK